MIEEKQNKLDIKDIRSVGGNTCSDCNAANTHNQPTKCFENARIAYIDAGNIKSSSKFRRIGVVLDNENTPRNNFILELGFSSWWSIYSKDAARIMHHDLVLELLESALLTGDQVDICVNSDQPHGYRILDVCLKHR